VLRGTIAEAAELQDSQARQQQIDGLIELCRRSFRMLPAQTVLEGRVRQDQGKYLPEIIFRNAPEIMSWDQAEDLNAITVLGLRPQLGGLFSLGLLRVSQPQDVSQDPLEGTQDSDWVILMPDIVQLSWRYYDPGSNSWMDALPQGSQRPLAVEMTLKLTGERDPRVLVFWVVPVVKQAAGAQQGAVPGEGNL